MESTARRATATEYAIALGLGLASFVLLFVNYWLPPGKIFDEVYFARAAEEYLTRQYIYENTHPPVTKLLITLSTMLFGGMHGGDNAMGWRFLDVVFGAASVSLLYVIARRITGSRLFGAYAAGLLALDGMHFVQSRIATPESFVVFFSLATFYAFYRYWTARAHETPPQTPGTLRRCLALMVAALLAAGAIVLRFPHETLAARIVAAVYVTAGLYSAYRIYIERRILREPSFLWLMLWAASIALLVSSKWYGVMAYGVAFVVVLWERRILRPDLVLSLVLFVTGSIYFASYTPQFIGLRDLPNLPPRAYTFSDIITMQYNAFEYHDHLKATHPYSSVWWQWPLDLRPILYYAHYGTQGGVSTAAMIYTLPNPLILWLGLLTVPLVMYWGVRERKKAYLLLALTYLAQWLPWMFSPRIAFNYHFYVDIPLICVCTAMVMQRISRAYAAMYFAAVALAFAYFYPILAGVTISTSAWMQRMWLHSWI